MVKSVEQTSASLDDAFDPMLAVRAWRKRWHLTAATLITGALLAGMATMQIKPKFESEASLYVRLGRESAGLDPTATTAEVAPIYETREQELNSVLEVMQSRKLLDAVVAVIGTEAILKPSEFSFEQWQISLASTNWAALDPELLHRSDRNKEEAVEALYKAINLEVEQTSNIIGISGSAATPELAQAITKTILEAYRVEHIRLNETHGLKFFTDQVTMLQAKLDAARQRLTQRKNELGIMSIEGERVRLEDVLTALEKQLNASVPELEGARASTAVMEHEVRSLPDRTLPHDAADTLRKTLHELEQHRETLLAKYTPRHFRVQDAAADIAVLEEQLANPKNRNAANPTLRELEVALATDRTRVAETEATIRELQRERAVIRTELMKLNDAEAEIHGLTDRIEQLKAATVKTTEKLEQARLLDQMSRERISNIRVVQPPTFNPVSTSPSRMFVLATGLVIAAIAAGVIPAVTEFGAWYLRQVRSTKNQAEHISELMELAARQQPAELSKTCEAGISR